MSSITDVMNTMANLIEGYLAPYQPNLPSFPNAASTAGQISATKVFVGYPVQHKVTTDLENHICQVGVVEGKLEVRKPWYTNEYTPISFNSATNSAIYEVARSEKQIGVQIWGYSYASREAIHDLIRAYLADFYRQTEPDGSITFVRYRHTKPFDYEQSDSIWVSEMVFMADHAVTLAEPTYPIHDIKYTVTVEGETAPLIDSDVT